MRKKGGKEQINRPLGEKWERTVKVEERCPLSFILEEKGEGKKVGTLYARLNRGGVKHARGLKNERRRGGEEVRNATITLQKTEERRTEFHFLSFTKGNVLTPRKKKRGKKGEKGA